MSSNWETRSNRQAENRRDIDAYRAESKRQASVAINPSHTLSMLRRFMEQNRPNGAFMTPELRDELVDSSTVFSITNIRDGETKFGATWFVDVLVDIGNGNERYTIPLAHNEVRDQQLSEFKAALESKTFNSLPVTLISFETDKGNPGYSFDSPPTDWWDQQQMDGMPDYEPDQSDVADDVIPF